MQDGFPTFPYCRKNFLRPELKFFPAMLLPFYSISDTIINILLDGRQMHFQFAPCRERTVWIVLVSESIVHRRELHACIYLHREVAPLTRHTDTGKTDTKNDSMGIHQNIEPVFGQMGG